MPNFPASLRFCSILTYDPDRTKLDPARLEARRLVEVLKRDSFYKSNNPETRMIPFVAKRIVELMNQHAFLADFFSADTLLIPVPRSSPLVKDGLWVPNRICDELLKKGLGGNVCPCLIRHEQIRKSATSTKGSRPDAVEHYATISVDTQIQWQFSQFPKVLLVDDVVTRGATFVGAYARTKEAFPNADIKCFAVVSTRGFNNFNQLLEPTDGIIEYQFDYATRIP